MTILDLLKFFLMLFIVTLSGNFVHGWDLVWIILAMLSLDGLWELDCYLIRKEIENKCNKK